MTLEELDQEIRQLREVNAYHVKRGFRLDDVPLGFITNHLLEEAVEFQAEMLFSRNMDSVKEEAADTLLCFLHALQAGCVSLRDVLDVAGEKLSKTFTTDPEKVLTKTPGFTRRNREETT
jgi:phosphoribosyl-ATP pyrophosphohydrolase